MTPEQFIATWQGNPLTERAGAQAHFDDLCDLLGVAKPRDPENYCFERGGRLARRVSLPDHGKRPLGDVDRGRHQVLQGIALGGAARRGRAQ
jgi:hypothetical protein